MRFLIAHRIIECVESYLETVESVSGPVNLELWGTRVRLGDTSVPLHADDFGPYFVIDLFPLLENFLDVVLQRKKEKYSHVSQSVCFSNRLALVFHS